MKRIHVAIKVPYEGQFSSIQYFLEDTVADGETPEAAFARVRAVVEAQARSEGSTQTSGAQHQQPAPRDSGRGPSPRQEIFTGRPDQWDALVAPLIDAGARPLQSPKWKDKLARAFDGQTMGYCFEIVDGELAWWRGRQKDKPSDARSRDRGGYRANGR